MKVKDILNRVTLLYHDKDFIRLTQEEYLRLLDDAIMQLILLRPDANEKRTVEKLVAGARQQIPEGALTLVDIYCNKRWVENLKSYRDGKPVFQVSRKDLDYWDKNWYANTDPSVYEIDEFAFDTRTPTRFWVNPPVDPSQDVYVEMGCSYTPITYSGRDDPNYDEIFNEDLFLNDRYKMALTNYMLYLCYSTDSTSQYDKAISDKYFQMFIQGLQLEEMAAISANPHIKEFTASGLGIYKINAPAQAPANQG